MANDLYRTKVVPQEVVPQPDKVGDGVSTQESNVEAPFTDYQLVHGHPFLVDHYELGDSWRDKLGSFEKEINTIEGYFKTKIEHGKLQNNKEAVTSEIKKMYKLCNIEDTERTTMQIEKLAAYIEFLKKTDDISLNHEKYGST